MHHPAHAPVDTVTFSRAYPGRTDQAAQVRADLRALLDGCPVTDEVILCASELAANAVVHSHSGYLDATFTIRAEIHHGNYAWVEVEDGGGTWTELAYDPTRGRGLDIVRAVAADWGIDGDHRGRVIWARINWPERW
jgi:anti-sigma regulatory factor (Ser/Thr protein kinase)